MKNAAPTLTGAELTALYAKYCTCSLGSYRLHRKSDRCTDDFGDERDAMNAADDERMVGRSMDRERARDMNSML